ncbi:S-adenosylmethionine-binding protein [Paracoccus sp. 11-3]|uniref:S-adenosylmethionine-binding protein n=1 Tax=Paracoccus amoyensis TaxID=2760093 RepID=A0A926GMQ5_9RHOB|nr:MT-A70 family methyltransferase [Paracoccus amoyensis]MBC9246725.1 S-adenosylmethionine-binding protein [Paracoccus amoyensis]
MLTPWPFGDLRMFGYQMILADPPWPYEMRSDKGYQKSPEAHYPTMPIAAIKALPVADLAGPDCYLFMWSTWPHLPVALDVLRHWGFAYVTGGSWLKRTRNWNVAMGTGYVLRSATEPYLVGKIGRPRPDSRSERNVIIAPELVIDTDLIPDSIEAIRREHSRKPIEMRAMVERLCPQASRCELFGREAWAGADVWGNQSDLFTAEDTHV